MSRVPLIEPQVRYICRALNAIPGVMTFSSCGGHPNPEPPQADEGEFWVCFCVQYTAEGWDSLERIAAAIQDTSDEGVPVTLTPWVDGGLNFQIDGVHQAADAIGDRLSH